MNFRPVVCIAVVMIAAVVLSCRVLVSQTSRLILIVMLAAIILALVTLCVCKKKIYKFLIPMMLAFLIPVVSVYTKSERINANNRLNVENYSIYGKIYKINENLDKNYIDVYLTNVELSNDNEENNFYGNYLVRIHANNFDVSKIDVGGFIKVSSTSNNLYSLNSGNERDISFIARDIMGFSYAYSYNVSVFDDKKPTLRDNVKSSVFKYFQETDLFFTGIGYAMMFGESYMLEDSVYGVFKESGTVHLLAVSGFHVSVIVGVLLFILKKLKVKNIVNFIITSIVVFFYAYLCNFSVSIIRAGIMSLIALYATMRNKECDKMSSMSLAAILILLLNPLDVFNISFVLSFVAVLSIILLLPVLERLFSRFFNNKLAGMLALSVSTSIGITMFQLFYFGKAPVLAFLSNIITVPLVSILFIYLLISVLIGVIFSVAAPLISVFGIGIKYVLQLNNWIARFGLFLVTNYVREITLFLSILLMYSLSDYLFIKRKSKLMMALFISGLMLSLLIF